MKKANKLSLKQETIRNLSAAQLAGARGAGAVVASGACHVVQSEFCIGAGGAVATSGSITSEYGYGSGG